MQSFSNSPKQTWLSRFEGAPVTKWLLVLNVLIYLIDRSGFEPYEWGRLSPLGLFSSGEHLYAGGLFKDTLSSFELWRLIGFQFLHGDIGHLIFNMFAIFMFGALVERLMGSIRFIVYYLLCGVGGALFYTLLVSLGWLGEGVLVGASAGIFGMLVALIVIAPDMLVRPMLLTEPVPIKVVGMIILGLGVFTVVSVGENAGGEAGHLGGALIGYLLMKNPGLLNWVENFRGAKRQSRKPKRDYVPKIRPRTTVNMASSEVDRILDKVSDQGLHSLTDKERATLKAQSEID